ncbi:MAG: hypothetical protein EOP64_04205 [Sphingomonas sp.]|nr:MAG: hypothetical protein EOP64_04205 [Sphingomonas sp.]
MIRLIYISTARSELSKVELDGIKGDARHFAAVTLDSRSIAERSFPGWAMGHQPGKSLRGDGQLQTM